MSIMVPVLIVSGLGATAGILLSIASILMHVPTDEKQLAVRDALPGANCGACGYTGCDEYAKAVSGDNAAITLCIPGGIDVVNALAEIMGTQADKVEKIAAVVRCAGTNDHTNDKMRYIGEMTCVYANQLFSGPGDCSYGCLGMGDCKNVCEYGAIQIENGIAAVDPEKCIGCSLCVQACPKAIIELAPVQQMALVACSNKNKGAEARKVCSSSCIGCMKCTRVCPHDAIHVTEFLAAVNYDKCTACGECVTACPQNCIALLS